jgi:hypothetical protein
VCVAHGVWRCQVEPQALEPLQVGQTVWARCGDSLYYEGKVTATFESELCTVRFSDNVLSERVPLSAVTAAEVRWRKRTVPLVLQAPCSCVLMCVWLCVCMCVCVRVCVVVCHRRERAGLGPVYRKGRQSGWRGTGTAACRAFTWAAPESHVMR